MVCHFDIKSLTCLCRGRKQAELFSKTWPVLHTVPALKKPTHLPRTSVLGNASSMMELILPVGPLVIRFTDRERSTFSSGCLPGQELDKAESVNCRTWFLAVGFAWGLVDGDGTDKVWLR